MEEAFKSEPYRDLKFGKPVTRPYKDLAKGKEG